MTGAVEFALGLSYELATISDRSTYLNACNSSLARLIPADSLGWVRSELSARRIEMVAIDDSGRRDAAELLAANLDRHPMYVSYLSAPHQMAPRRMSDLIPERDWIRHPVYNELFAPLGIRHQVVLTLRSNPPVEWDVWAFNRVRDDFTDTELELCRALQPMLISLDQLIRRVPAMPSVDRVGSDLTPRELEVLRLLAADFTAFTIANILRVSARTVRKHLEHIYVKLQSHDRLGAVSEAARRGILDFPVLRAPSDSPVSGPTSGSR